MKRRTFLKNLSYAGGTGLFLGGMPIKSWAANSFLRAAVQNSGNDKVIVFVQLHGGNDALNTIVPINQYNDYYNYRPNIALPSTGNRKFINLDNTLPIEEQVGLHPDILAFKELYENGSAAIVQNVGYENMNLSHFRGRDIMFMGGGANDDYGSGWLGRFLDTEYPGYPDGYPSESQPDPIGIEIGNTQSLAFHRNNGIPIGFNVQSPQAFYELITNVGIEPPIEFPDSHAGDELRYLMEFEKKSNQYAGRLKEVYEAGKNSSVVYPETYPLYAPSTSVNNPLSGQLRLIARLLAGGLKTRVFLCRIGGFDTHGDQVEAYDPTLGNHSALLYHLFSGLKAFHDDLENLGMGDKAICLTITEFGRRVYSNASYGTDHGTASPVFLTGKGLRPGIYGENPDLTDLRGGNIKYAIDYRQVYAAVVKDWFEASQKGMDATGFNPWVNSRLPLFTDISNVPDKKLNSGQVEVFPIPARQVLNLRFHSKKQLAISQISLMDTQGKRVSVLANNQNAHHYQTFTFNISHLKPGMYLLIIDVEEHTMTKKVFVQQ